MDFSEITPHMELDDPIFIESSPNLAFIPAISSLSSSLASLPSSLNPPYCTLVEPETFVLGRPCLG